MLLIDKSKNKIQGKGVKLKIKVILFAQNISLETNFLLSYTFLAYSQREMRIIFTSQKLLYKFIDASFSTPNVFQNIIL